MGQMTYAGQLGLLILVSCPDIEMKTIYILCGDLLHTFPIRHTKGCIESHLNGLYYMPFIDHLICNFLPKKLHFHLLPENSQRR